MNTSKISACNLAALAASDLHPARLWRLLHYLASNRPLPAVTFLLDHYQKDSPC